ncbi:hypothetical protein DFH07DRAFT_801767 [Mycena maculata]|uniref:Uncharacterized protein n=1 Tax=Mycena maculata TaxID=230809 RepID=A0AAD7JXX2_9AGAR|nr:hypothetical protein DFH07DRAFT_801767 [Mycena maculata]
MSGGARYVHYTPPYTPPTHPTTTSHPTTTLQPQPQQPTTVSPQDTQKSTPKPAARQNQAVASGSGSNAASGSGSGNTGGGNAATASGSGGKNGNGGAAQQPVVAKGNWTKDLVQLAKTAELKKHALTLQLHTAHILSAHASLEQKNRAVEDIREQRNKLESERARLIECLSQVNEDRNQADLLLTSLARDVSVLQSKIGALSEGEYAQAKADVDRLRAELGQPPLPGLQATLEGRGAGYLTDRRTAGSPATVNPVQPQSTAGGAPEKKRKRTAASGTNGNGSGTTNTDGPSGAAVGAVDGATGVDGDGAGQPKRPRGRPRGSRNRGAAGG